MPEQNNNTQRQNGDGKSWAQWKRELSDAIEELDKACAKARQTIYQLRPLVRPKPWTEPATQPRAEG
jgi:hypothetical protein